MNAVLRMEEWTEHHHPKMMDYLRILTGLFLIYRGFSFDAHETLIHSMILHDSTQYFTFMASQYFILVGIGGGILLISGLLTRFASIINLPIFIAMVFFVSLPNGFQPINTDLISSIIMLALLLLFTVYGSGKLSADNYIKKHKDT